MSLTEDIADVLAKETLALENGVDDTIVDDIAKTIGASSTTLEEAFLTAVRIRRAEGRALKLLAERKARDA